MEKSDSKKREAGVNVSISNNNFGTIPLKVYLAGAALLMLGFVNLLFIILDTKTNPYYFLFLYSIPSNSAVSLFPHEPIVILFGKQFNLLLIALVCSAGTLTAAFLDHTLFTNLLNHNKISGFKRNSFYKKAAIYFNKYPFCTLVIAGFTPIPFSPFKFLSFSSGYPLWRYLAAVVAGRFPRYYLLAAFGERTLIPDWIIWTIFAGLMVSILMTVIKAKHFQLFFTKSKNILHTISGSL